MMKRRSSKSSRKAEMSLEYIIKLIILIVVAVVVIGMIMNFRNDITNYIQNFFGKKTGPTADSIEQIKGNFTASQVAKYIEGCWARNKGKTQDQECYFLHGKFADVSDATILANLDQKVLDTSKNILFAIGSTDFGALVIKYDSYNPKTSAECIIITD